MDADFRSFIGKSFDDIKDNFNDEESVLSFENNRYRRIKNDINRKKQFKQEKKND